VISVAFKTLLETRLGICIYKISLLHRSDDCIGFTPSCPSTAYKKLHSWLHAVKIITYQRSTKWLHRYQKKSWASRHDAMSIFHSYFYFRLSKIKAHTKYNHCK